MNPKMVRLDLNNSGSWKTIGRFDAADEDHASLVMDAAEQLIVAINNGAPPKRCATLRICIDDYLNQVLARWDAERGHWYDAKTGEPC